MPTVDLIDETFIVAAPRLIAARVAVPQTWRQWWPDLQLTVFQDRGPAGVRWSIAGALVGSMEVWVQPFADGAIVHYYLRARGGTGTTAAETRRWALRAKQIFWSLKDELEGDRAPGCAPVGPA